MISNYTLKNYKETFNVYGSFYSVIIPNLGKVKCRNVLKISRKKSNNEKISAIFIMMNPGSGKAINPLEEDLRVYTLDEFINNGGPSISLIETIPDNVQMETMKIMDLMNWDNVYIINLNDVRNPNSQKFKDEVKNIRNSINEEDKKSITSIFNNYRKDKELIMNESKNVICCFGVSNPKYMTNEMVNYLKNKKIIPKGIKKDNDESKYYYLKPLGGKSIVDDLVKILKK